MSRWAHLAPILFILICALNRHSDTMQQRRRHQKMTKLIAAQAEQHKRRFNSAHVEIELVDEPGRVIKVLLDLGASCSVLSKRALEGVFHSLIRSPPKAKLIVANGGSLGLGGGVKTHRQALCEHPEQPEQVCCRVKVGIAPWILVAG